MFTNSSFYDEVKTRVHKRQASQDEQDIDSDSDDEAEADADARQRQRRAQPRLTPGANRCYLALVADHRFFKEIGNSNVKLTTAYLVINIPYPNYINIKATRDLHLSFNLRA